MSWLQRLSMRRHPLVRIAASMLALTTVVALPTPARAEVFVSVTFAPPPLPVYAQPMIPGPGYIWTPGYWAWGGDGYYWVPGTWVLAPFIGALWTPGWWGWSRGVYVFHPGYWGTRVGFYGGIDYGYGYGGRGYDGGYWRDGGFYYNRSVNRVGTRITNVYNRTVVNRTTIINRTSFNGGPGGVDARATPQQRAWARNQRFGPVAAQRQQRDLARRTPALRAAANRGMPAIAATPRAGDFHGRGATAARGAPFGMEGRGDGRVIPRAPDAGQRGALRSAGFAPSARTMDDMGNARGMNPQRRNAESIPARGNRIVQSGPAELRQPGELRSARFAPHAENAPRSGDFGRRGNGATLTRDTFRANDYRAEATGMPNRYQPADNGYRRPIRALQEGYSAPRAMPQPYRAEPPRAAYSQAAPRAQQAPAAGHGRGRGRNDHQD